MCDGSVRASNQGWLERSGRGFREDEIFSGDYALTSGAQREWSGAKRQIQGQALALNREGGEANSTYRQDVSASR